MDCAVANWIHHGKGSPVLEMTARNAIGLCAVARGRFVELLFMPRVFPAIILVMTATAASAETTAENQGLQEALEIATRGYDRMAKEIEDYTCLLTKRERVDGRLFDHEMMRVKIRHPRVNNGVVVTPFSVYVKFFSPARLKGREVIYVEGRNDGKLIVRNGGPRFGYITTSVRPDSPAALQQNRYPITEIGVMNLTARLIEAGEGKLRCRDCEAKIAPGAKIEGRPCTLIQVYHTVRRESQTFKFARIFVDDDLQLPVRFSSFDWPRRDGGAPILLEEYTYTDIKLNVGLTDWDFDHRNDEYKFLKSFEPVQTTSSSRTQPEPTAGSR
jgi:hypothetical protein